MSAEPAERLRRRKVLFDIEAKVEKLQDHQLSASQLKNLKISVLPMVLDEKSDLKPTFFAACPSVPELDEFDLGEYPSAKTALQFDPSGDFVRPLDRAYALEDYLVHYTCRCENRKWLEGTPTPWSGGCVADYHPFKSLYQYSDPEFGALRLTDIAGKEHPHMKAVIYNNIEENEQEYFRGELLAILRLMFGQMKQRRFIQHMISPVLVFSLMGIQRARVIESYFDGENLILRSTGLYDFREKDVKGLKDFAGWWIGNPIGDTISV
ncbi:hypothetical protein I7I50_10708 [Histoplasma capsulatum G186AR]|uniref:Uncharacterized protein n=1 Tax=Ajellomyces capsulatus TaxID=5037 RepID=A0A8H7ZA39_AJECA|nr:hypothetical protein I7I52_01946 [Histoplasma capsulatum]QSS69422.1 hypothetical protein I7I50_10708 [Histoplasma capsulatum G186AR]